MHNSAAMIQTKNYSTLFLWLGIAGLLLFLFYFPFPSHNAFWALLQDTGHLPLFGVISILLLSIVSRAFANFGLSRGWLYLAAFLSALLISALVEVIQGFMPDREVSFSDFYLGATGSLCFLLARSLFDEASTLSTSLARKIIISAICVSLLLGGTYPLLALCVSYLQKRQAFPILLTFEQTWPSHFLTLRENERHSNRPPGKSSTRAANTPAGFTRFTPDANADWPFIRLDEVVENWQGYTTLQLTIISEARERLPVTILLDDQHARPYSRHSQRHHRRLAPGLNRISLPLVARTSQQMPNTMDLGHMSSIWIAFPRPKAGPRPAGDVLIGEIRLH